MIHTILQDKHVILASASPRREEIFRLIGLNPLIFPTSIHEPVTEDPPQEQVMQHALNKANTAKPSVPVGSVIIGADTIVVMDKQILGKPSDSQQAAEYLSLLSGKVHEVYTGVCILHDNLMQKGYELSQVRFATLTDAEIDEYLLTQESMDKAGAYGIQGYGAQFIEHILGCYFNVMGFPINLFYKLLKNLFSCDG